MGLLDSVLGQVLGGAQPQPHDGGIGSLGGMGGGLGDLGGLAGALGGLLANNGEQGGLGGLVSKFNAATLLPMLATLLPTLIDQLTPKGQVPAEGLGNQDDLLASLSGLLQKG